VPSRTLEHYPLVIGLVEAHEERTARELVRAALEHVDHELISRHAAPPKPREARSTHKKPRKGKRA